MSNIRMVYMFKSCRFINDKIVWVVVDQQRNIINYNPSIDELKNLEFEKGKIYRNVYNITGTCDICGDKLKPRNACREYEDKGNWTGRWLCVKCGNKMPYSENGIRKMLADRRTHNIKPNSKSRIGDMFQRLTCEWLCVEDLNILNDNYRSPIDHSEHSVLGILQTSGRFLTSIHGVYGWEFNANNDHNKQFDNKVCYCASKCRSFIEGTYIFPRNEIVKRTSITIKRLPIYNRWYESYKVIDEISINKINEIWNRIIEDDGL